MHAARPKDEIGRLDALCRYDILDSQAEQAYDDITKIAAYVAQTPIALISLIDADRQWFKSKVGTALSETPRELAFCAHAILDPGQCLIVPNTLEDRRFSGNPLVVGEPGIRFYFGAPLVTADNHALGTLCVIDRVQRQLTPEQIEALTALSRQVMAQLELRRHTQEIRHTAQTQRAYVKQLEKYQKELETANARLRDEGMTDALTGIPNRGTFDRRLDEELYRAARYGSSASLLLIDVDKFKDLNDSLGHRVGDAALKSVAKALDCVRPSDFLCRYGGEEFAVILPMTEREGACILAERLRAAVAETNFPHRAVTVSIGASTTLPGETDPSRLIESADRALYAAKSAGRNRIVHSDTIEA